MKKMSKKFQMEDIGINSLVGKQVLSASVNEDKDLIILNTKQGNLYLTWEGDCCSDCFLAHVEGSEFLIGSVIMEVTHAEWKVVRNGDDYNVIESMGTNIRTSKGNVSFESRLEHNGFYSGAILVSDIEPMDQYACSKYGDEPLPQLLKLTDF